MRQLILLSLGFATIAIAAAKTAGECKPEFSKYLNCIAADTGDPVKGKALDQEFDDDFCKHCADCYNPEASSSSTKCILSRANLDTDICSDDGPLHGCSKCQDYCNEIRKRIFDASPSVKACFRQKFSEAVVNDLQPVIRTQLNDQTFSIPPLPDFDKATDGYQDIVRGIDHRVMAYNRLGVCKEQHPERAAVTGPCMDDKKGLYHLHCDLSRTCSHKVSSDCTDVFGRTKTATCKCMVIKRDEWHARLDKIREAVFNDQHSSTVCASGVKTALGHWVADFQSIADACLPKDEKASGNIPNLPLDKLIDAACVQAVEAASDGGKSAQLLSGFRAIRNILDAFNDRISSFCDVNCF